MMRDMRKLPPFEYVSSLFLYDAETGFFHHKTPREKEKTRRPLNVSGGRERRKIYVKDYGQFQAHRVAWLLHHAQDPWPYEIDHIDGDPCNNRIANLRLATSAQQKLNKGVQSNNRSGLKGAYYHACRRGKKWRSQIKIGSYYEFIGYFSTAQEAHEAYLERASQLSGEFMPQTERTRAA